MMKKQKLHLLNDDVIFEKILPWLPPKSLLMFRSVSKSWYSAISDPYFIAKHQSHFGNNNCFISLLVTQKHDSVLKQQNLNLPGGLVVVEDVWVPEDLANKASSGRYRIMASCNGLFCYASLLVINDDDRIYLCNPSIRWTRAVVPFRFSTNHGKYALQYTYGVGFDRSTNDYKVIMLGEYMGISSTARPINAALYSVKANSWKQLNNVPGGPPLFGLGDSIFLHGFIHWLSYSSSTYKDNKIVVFDVGNEVFGEIKLPPHDDERYFTDISISTGSLCFLARKRVVCDMWIMKEYGVAESWTKQAVILDIEKRLVRSTQAIVAGKILSELTTDYVLGFPSKLALFDPQTSLFQYINVSEPKHCKGLVSLVPTLELLDVIM